MLLYRVPLLVQKLLPRVLWRGPREDEVYLTFDDGPDPVGTKLVLELLAAHGCPATFFVTGARAATHPHLVRAIVQAGHGLGSHSFHHTRLAHLSTQALVGELLRADRLLASILGWAPCYFRPPYGTLTPAMVKAAARCGKTIVMWTASTSDYHPQADPARIARWLRRHVRGGDIVLLHDGLPTSSRTAQALALFLPHLTTLGLHGAVLPGAAAAEKKGDITLDI